MGYSLSWLAIRGIAYPQALERQSLRPTEQTADYAEHPICGMPDAGGWSLIVAQGCDHRIVSADNLVTLSLECEVIACSVEEHVMVSAAEHWVNGVRQWRVEHDAQQSIDHLATYGSMPADFAATRDRFAAQQMAEGGEEAGADYYFEVPLVLAQARVGFKHDEGAEFRTDGKFQVLKDLVGRKPWWRVWA